MLLITGGTGSFGSAYLKHHFCTSQGKYIKKGNVQCKIPITIYSRDWLKQKQLREELGNPANITWILGDLRDKERLKHATRLVTHVIHAAAIKCIDACEKNPQECLSINVNGTQNLLDCLNPFITKILISTDKAVLPVNTYGTSKKMAEKLWINQGGIVCRYGNVIGSAGSVLPYYRKLRSEGAKSLPVTDERMTRFWLPMADAIALVDKALESGKPGELMIPDMPSIRIIGLVKALRCKPYFTGIREGEKLHEWIIPPDEILGTQGLSSGNNPWFLTIEEIRRSIDGV
jgi:UDP-N-acetylglucosamine 4,6-dehydratase